MERCSRGCPAVLSEGPPAQLAGRGGTQTRQRREGSPASTLTWPMRGGVCVCTDTYMCIIMCNLCVNVYSVGGWITVGTISNCIKIKGAGFF